MHGPLADHDIIREDHRERLVANQLLRHQDGVAEAQLLLLPHVGDLGEVADVADLAEALDLAALLEQVLQLVAEVEVILDRPLLAGRDDDHLLDARRHGLLDRVLDDRLVDEREHLLGLGLGGGQEAGAPAGGGEDGLADAHGTSDRSHSGGGCPGEVASSNRARPVYEGRGALARASPVGAPPGPRSGGSARRFVRLGSLAAALEQGGPGQHEHAAGDLHGTEQLGEEDRRQRGAGHRLDQAR